MSARLCHLLSVPTREVFTFVFRYAVLRVEGGGGSFEHHGIFGTGKWGKKDGDGMGMEMARALVFLCTIG